MTTGPFAGSVDLLDRIPVIDISAGWKIRAFDEFHQVFGGRSAVRRLV